MSSWGETTYGDPCRECGFSWSISSEDARALVGSVPAALAIDLATATGRERHPELGWSVAGYVAHIGDNLRIWAERVAGISAGGPSEVVAYDENALAAARVYDQLGVLGVLWTLERSVRDWLDSLHAAPTSFVMHHPSRGELDLLEVIRSNAHDAAHHLWDIRRSLVR